MAKKYDLEVDNLRFFFFVCGHSSFLAKLGLFNILNSVGLIISS